MLCSWEQTTMVLLESGCRPVKQFQMLVHHIRLVYIPIEVIRKYHS